MSTWPDPRPTPDEAEALRSIRRWRTAIVVMWAMTLPVIFTALYAWPDAAFAVVALWFGLVVFVAIKIRGPCPRCKRRFPVRDLGMNPWEKGCLHCGLRIDPKTAGE